MTDKLTDEERVTLRALTEEVSGIVWAADFVNDLATALSTERTAREEAERERDWAMERAADRGRLAIADMKTIAGLTAELAASEERVKSLTEELEATKPSACWKRGIMHAIERLDLIIGPSKVIKKKDLPATLDRVRAVLDELTEFARKNAPASYLEAADLCSADYKRSTLTAPDKGETM